MESTGALPKSSVYNDVIDSIDCCQWLIQLIVVSDWFNWLLSVTPSQTCYQVGSCRPKVRCNVHWEPIPISCQPWTNSVSTPISTVSLCSSYWTTQFTKHLVEHLLFVLATRTCTDIVSFVCSCGAGCRWCLTLQQKHSRSSTVFTSQEIG